MATVSWKDREITMKPALKKENAVLKIIQKEVRFYSDDQRLDLRPKLVLTNSAKNFLSDVFIVFGEQILQWRPHNEYFEAKVSLNEFSKEFNNLFLHFIWRAVWIKRNSNSESDFYTEFSADNNSHSSISTAYTTAACREDNFRIAQL